MSHRAKFIGQCLAAMVRGTSYCGFLTSRTLILLRIISLFGDGFEAVSLSAYINVELDLDRWAVPRAVSWADSLQDGYTFMSYMDEGRRLPYEHVDFYSGINL